MNQVHVYKPIVRKDKEKFEFVKKNVKIFVFIRLIQYNLDDDAELSF